MFLALTKVASGSSSASIAASAAGWIGSAGCPTTSAGAAMARRRLDEGAIRPKNSPCTTAPIESARWSRVSRTIPVQNGTTPRGIGRVSRRKPLTVNGQEAGGEHQRGEGEDPGLDGVVEHGHLDDQAAHPLGRDVGDLEADVGAQGGAADDGLLGAEVVEQGDDLLGERGHRVDERVGRAVGAAVPEQVEGDDVQALRGERPGQRLLHAARHQLAVEQDDPGVTRAVLGVLQTVATILGLEEELADALGDQHADHDTTGRVTRGTSADGHRGHQCGGSATGGPPV